MQYVQVHVSALKRGLSVDEVIRMWNNGIDETVIDDNEPPRYMRLSFDGWKSVVTKMQRRLK